MKVFTIKKKNGKNRTIFAPSHAEKARMRLMVPELNELQRKNCDPDVVNGFYPTHSPVTNALKHVGYSYTLCMDLKDFFDSVTPDHFTQYQGGGCSIPQPLWADVSKVCFPKGACHQGPPTSPALANLACVQMDRSIKETCRKVGMVYTRYADDLCVSGNDIELIKQMRSFIDIVTGHYKFTANRSKTRIQWAGPDGDWSRIITGVAVGKHGIRPTRSVRRRLRAALHQRKKAHAEGLAEWCRLKLPNSKGSPRISKVDECVARSFGRRVQGLGDVWK